MSVEIRHLRHFVAVAEELHFARAAARVGIEQSPLSQSIKDLEGRLGVKLFHRTTRATTLTPQGEVFLKDARRVLALVEGMRRDAREMARGKRGRIRLGVCSDVSCPRIAQLVRRWCAELPAVSVEIRDGDMGRQVAELKSGVLDVCFAPEEVCDPEVLSFEFCREPLMAWIPEDHALAACERVSVAEIEPLRVFATRVAILMALVSVGAGVALVPSSVSPPAQTQIVTRALADQTEYASVWVVFRRLEESALIKRVLEMSREACELSGAAVSSREAL